MRKSDNYAGNQVRLFLGDLKNGSHQSKLKSIEKLQNYIKSYQPNISDDNVDYLYTGCLDGNTTTGLLEWCGADSEKHDGQLKRICAPLIGFLKWLVTFPDDSIYYERFVRLSQEDLNKVNFPKHISSSSENRFNIPGQSRSGSWLDAFELLCILINEHRNVEDEIEPVDLGLLLRGNKQCQIRFEEWLQKSNVEHISDTLQLLRNTNAAGAGLEKEVKRPRTWGEVNFKCVPLQEGEDDGNADVESESDELPPIPDPLEVSGMDLRKTQELYSSGQLHKSAMRTRRNTAALLAYDVSSGVVISSKSSTRDSAVTEHVEEDDDDDDDEMDRNTFGPEKRSIPSVVPSDKSFSASLFLSLVHGNTSFEDMKKGLDNLKQHLTQQSKRRENLVRTHFGLFVQCSDGLEWLKSYRKGVMKPLDVPKVRSYRRSLVDDSQRGRSNSTALETSVNDKGMDKLKKAQKTLDIAKSEAKSTLAPILERMKHSREIKSAEKVLKGMSSLLDHPHGMKKAMERNEFKEVVSIYQRVKNIPSTASLRIVPKIKVAADSVLLDLKRQCFSILLSPNKNFPELLRYSQLIMELDGANAYLDVLRQTFLRQLIYFVESLLEVYQKFCADCVDAYDKGQELNIVLMNSHIASVENDSFISIVKKFAGQTTKRKSQSVRRQSASPAQITKNISRDSFSSEGIIADDSRTEVLSEGGIVDDGFSFYESDDEFLSELDYIERMRGGGYNFKDIIDKAQQDGIESLTTNKDYSELLCNIVRKSLSDNIMEISSQWFSCLFRLACEIMSQQIAIGKSSVSVAPNTFKVATAPGSTNPNSKQQLRNSLSSNRLLAQAIGLGTDMLQQAVQGIAQNFRKFSLSSELINAIQELDQYVVAAEKTYGCSLPRGYMNLLAANMETGGRFPDLLMLPVFQSQIKSFLYHACLTQAFVLFDGMECSMKTVLQSLQENNYENGNKIMQDLGGGSTAQKLFSTDQASLGRPTNRAIALTKSVAREVYELEYSSPTSPYYDCMQTLQLLSQEGEIAVCQKLMESLVDRVFDLTDTLFNDSDVEVPFVSIDAKSSVECSIKQIEDLLFKGVNVLKRHTRRPEWIAATVYESFFQKLLISVLERLRRKAVAISESKNGFSVTLDSSHPSQGSSRRHLKKPHASARASMHQNQLILQSLEEELRNMDIGWERDSGDSTYQNKPSAWVDFVRGCIRFRSQSVPKMLKELMKTFPLDVIPAVQLSNFSPSKSVQPSKAAVVPASAISSGPSLLNRLFSFDGPPELPPSDSKATENSKLVISDSSLAIDNKGGNLFDRIMKYVSENGSFSEELSSKIGSQFIKPFYEELVRIETTATEKYLQYRINGIKTILSSSYTLLLHQDMKGTGNSSFEKAFFLPNHITRIILALNEERNLLNERLALFTVESGCLIDSIAYQSEEKKRIWGESEVNATIQAHDTTKDYGKYGNDQKYCSYLYQELCQGVLKSYQDLLTKLLYSQPLTSSSSGKFTEALPKGTKVELPYRTLNQAFEEYEFFKIVLRPNFLDTQFLQKQQFSSAELSAFSKEKCSVQREDLLKCGQLLANMIQ